jgi:peptidoglycan-associated lipoprotein
MNARFSLIALAVVAMTVSACTPKTTPATSPDPMVNPDSIAARAAREQAAAAERARVEAENRARMEREAAERAAREAAARAEAERAAALTAARNAFGTVIYFAYDKSDLTADSRAVLDAKLPLLRANANVRIRIAGHTDERGSDAYNVALGQRRAAAAKRYLVDQGIAEGRIDVVSFGEERPAQVGTDETAWSKNRRDEFEIIIGGETLRLP